MNNQVSGAEVYESFDCIWLSKVEVRQHVLKTLFTIWLICDLSIAGNNLEALQELILSVHLYHVVFEFFKFTSGDVDHLLLILVPVASCCLIVGSVIVPVVVGASCAVRAWLLLNACKVVVDAVVGDHIALLRNRSCFNWLSIVA